MNCSVVGIIRVAVSTLALAMCVLAMSMPSWMVQQTKFLGTDKGSATLSAGLWKACTSSDAVNECSATTVQAASLLIVGFMVSAGVLLLIGSLACSVLHVTDLAANPTVVYAGGALAAAAGVLLLMAFSVFADYMSMQKDTNDNITTITNHYGAAFAIDIVACVISMATALLFIVPQFREIPQN